MNILDLEFITRNKKSFLNVLKANDIRTVEDLSKMTPEEVCGLCNMGKVGLATILQALAVKINQIERGNDSE